MSNNEPNRPGQPSSSIPVPAARRATPKNPALAAAWQKAVNDKIAAAMREGTLVDSVTHRVGLPTPLPVPTALNEPTASKTTLPKESEEHRQQQSSEPNKPHASAIDDSTAPTETEQDTALVTPNPSPTATEKSLPPSPPSGELIADLPPWQDKPSPTPSLSSIDLRSPSDDPDYEFIEKSEAIHSARNAHADRKGKYPELEAELEAERAKESAGGNAGPKGKDMKKGKKKGWFF